jgi:hypothetical protein
MIDERRAAQRFLLHSPVAITGVDDSGLQFDERSRLEDVGDLGCRFSIRNAVRPGGILGVEPLGPEGEKFLDEFSRLFVIIWIKRDADRLMLGARCLGEHELSDGCFHTNRSHSKVSAK